MSIIKRIIKKLSLVPSINNINLLQSLLKKHLILIDIGSTVGIEEKWKTIEQLLHVITFDPDPRAFTPTSKGKFNNFSTGLWSEKDKKHYILQNIHKHLPVIN